VPNYKKLLLTGGVFSLWELKREEGM